MKNFTKPLFLFCILFSLFGKSTMNAQSSTILPEYVFFQGDSLNGFDWKTNFDVATADHLDNGELLAFLYNSEHTYVINKYHIVVDKAAPITLQADAVPNTPTGVSACNNLDFADGDYTNWTGGVGVNNNSAAALTLTANGITTHTLGINAKEYACSWFTLVNTGTDPFGKFPMLAPGGVYSCRLGGEKANVSSTYGCGNTTMSPGTASMGEVIQQSYPVTKANALFTYEYAVVLCDGGHPTGQQPYFSASVVDANGNNIPCLTYYEECTNGTIPPGYSKSDSTIDPSMSISCNNGVCDTTYTGGYPVYYLPWTVNSINLTNYIGTTITIKFTVAGCTAGGHFGYAYIDGACGTPLQLIINHQCGSATITAPPGSTKYSWSGPGITGSSSSQTITVNVTGTYSATMTSSQGCSYTLDTLVTIPPPPTFTTTATPATCTTKGTATVTNLSGGTLPYTYLWNPSGQTTNPATGLSIGTYSIIVTDNGGCSKTETVTITEPSTVIAYTVAMTGVSCFGGNNGTATASASSGTAPYTYSWSTTPPQTTNTATGLSAGVYTVTVTDSHGCTAIATVTVSQPTPVGATTTTVPAFCGLNNGSATASATGGTSPYTYLWATTPAQSTATATGLGSGIYTVTVTDNKGCSTTAIANVIESSSIIPTMGAPVNILCNGGNNGSANVTLSGGTAPYTYLWTPSGGNTASATGLTAGSYTVTIHDAIGCSATASVIITQPALLKATMGNPTNATCATLGSATVSVTGGTVPYTYSWTPSGGNTATGSGLTAGTYTVEVIDLNGCTTSATVVITQPSGLKVSIVSFTNVLCNGGNNGSATCTVTGGVTPYTYTWTPSGGKTANATGLTAGSYTITIQDANGCISAATVTITQPLALVTTTGFTPASCNLYNGSANVTVTNGITPYTYLWSTNPAQTTSLASGISAATYTVHITDNNGCTTSTTVTVTQPPAVTATISGSTDISCYLANDGTATVSATSGNVPYTYLWNPSGQTATTATGLSAGTYTVSATDNVGCISTTTVIITQPPLLTATMGMSINPSCGKLGSATVNVTGGTTPYTYLWSPIPENTATATGLTAGTYSVAVTDAHGCTSAANVTITQPPPLGITTDFTPASCNLANGSATVTATGASLPYTYLWTPTGQTTPTATGVSAGTYNIVVMDINGCTSSANVTVTQPPIVITAISGSTDITCYLANNGTATVSATNGPTPYTYLWTPTGQNTATATGLSAGTYTVSATDNVGCVSTSSVIITQPALLTVTIGAPTQVLCNGGNNGSATASTTGGTMPYTYLWSPSPIAAATANGLTAGTYTVTVTDANGCQASASVIITQPALLTANTKELTNVLCNGGNNGSAYAIGGGGSLPYTYTWSTNPVQNKDTATKLSAGVYTVIITDNHGCTAASTVTITQPLLLSTTDSVVEILCNGGTGSITTYPTGGTPPYKYAWKPTSAGVSASANNLSAGGYTVTVTDANGCPISSPATVTQPAALGVIVSGPALLCSGATGTLTASVTGGTLPYKYTWSAGATFIPNTNTASITPTVTTIYSVTVTDANGCQISGQTSVIVGPALVISTIGSTSICGGKTVNLCVQTSGGSGGNIYKWEPGSYTTPCINVAPLFSTTYTVSVTDNCGVTLSATATVKVAPAPIVSFYSYLYQGCVPLCINFYNNSSISSDSIVSYQWKFGNGDTSWRKSPIYCYPDTGTFSVTLTATSNIGCSSSLTRSDLIRVYPIPHAAFRYSPKPASILSPTVQFTDESNSIYPIALRTWLTFGDATDSTSNKPDPIHTYQDTGRYCPELAIVDMHGCTDTVINCLLVEPIFTLYIPTSFSPNGDGLNDVFTAKGVYVKTFEMYIFDRWGENIYHTNNINKGWDGTVKGGSTIAQEDTYVYKIIATDMENNQHSYIGNVTLIK